MEAAITIPPDYLDVLPQQWAGMLEALEKFVPGDRYEHWDEIVRGPEEGGVSREALWAALKLVRRSRRQPAVAEFGYVLTDSVTALLHALDRTGAEALAGSALGARLAASAMMREAVASAALSGAAVNLETGRELLRAGRPPLNRAEQAVVNVHDVLIHLRGQGDQPLTPDRLLDLHRRLTAGAIESPDAAGRLRRDGEKAGDYESGGDGGYQPPPAPRLPECIDKVCALANGGPADPFIHPVIRATVLHFLVACHRPFVDGNGRLARALFYWLLWRQDYGAFAYLPISVHLLADPRRYDRSFLETETDDGDLTYFILHQATAMREGLRAARERRDRKHGELQEKSRQGRGFAALNGRQQAVVSHALRHPEARYGIARHQHSHGVTHQTGRDDLFDLVRRNLLTVARARRVYVFRPATDLATRLRTPAPGRRRAAPSRPAGDELPTNLL